MNWREAFICLFLFCAALLLWQKLDTDKEVVVDGITTDKELPGYYLQGTELIRFNAQGRPLYTITADRIEENTKDQSLLLSDLNIVYESDSNNSWNIKADQATLPKDRKIINFSGNVIAQQLANKNTARFKSNRLKYDIENEILSTQDQVFANQGIQRISATGMTLNIKNEEVKLHSRVKIRLQIP